jgi:hypothetical protein
MPLAVAVPGATVQPTIRRSRPFGSDEDPARRLVGRPSFIAPPFQAQMDWTNPIDPIGLVI